MDALGRVAKQINREWRSKKIYLIRDFKMYTLKNQNSNLDMQTSCGPVKAQENVSSFLTQRTMPVEVFVCCSLILSISRPIVNLGFRQREYLLTLLECLQNTIAISSSSRSWAAMKVWAGNFCSVEAGAIISQNLKMQFEQKKKNNTQTGRICYATTTLDYNT